MAINLALYDKVLASLYAGALIEEYNRYARALRDLTKSFEKSRRWMRLPELPWHFQTYKGQPRCGARGGPGSIYTVVGPERPDGPHCRRCAQILDSIARRFRGA